MAESVAFSLLVLATIFAFLFGVDSATFTIINNCPYTIWPATLTGSGQQTPTGFELAQGASNSFDVAPQWSGRIWARTQCSTDQAGKFSCKTADCGSGQLACNGAGAIPPASLVEFTIGGWQNQDFYDVSLVDGFNLPVSVVPDNGNCKPTSCPVDVNAKCPPELAVPDSTGAVLGCKSACLAFNQPQYCCTGVYSTPATCPPTDYSRIFKGLCPEAYSYAFDDQTSTFTCATGQANYKITFCP
ncbi:PREDICTED: thaumatin-like protein 1b [Ipomoea nil]|uniref:thaumatin-like protein 1b n=1 Tax=Ipomoea nil TaxID=35883 RepID=UPI000901C31F|nr:PREDICTED: thaumatin-like protein 1b [Ipomoea nil]